MNNKKYKIFDTLLVLFLLIVSLSLIGLSTYFALDIYDKSANAYVVNDNLFPTYWRVGTREYTSNYTLIEGNLRTLINGNNKVYVDNYTFTFTNNDSTGYTGVRILNPMLNNENYTLSVDLITGSLICSLRRQNGSVIMEFNFSTNNSFTFNASEVYDIWILNYRSGNDTIVSNIKLESGNINTGFVKDDYLINGYDNGYVAGANSNASIFKLGDLYATIENDILYQLDNKITDYTGFIASDFVINVNGNYNFPFIYYKIVGSRYITIYSQNSIDNIDSVNILTENFLSNNNVIMLWLFEDSEEDISYLNVRSSSVYDIISPPRYVYKIDNVNAYTVAYRNGFIAGSDVNTQLYNTGYNDGVEYANNTLNTNSLSYFKGREAGIESANTYSFYTLMDAVMVTPVRYAFEVFNFDFFGINIKSLLTTLFTMCLFALILKLCLKFIGV